MDHMSTKPFLVDSHCHLDFEAFDADRDMVVERARQAGLGCMLTISTRVRQFEKVYAIAQTYDDVYCSVGTHPHNSHEEIDVNIYQLIEISKKNKVVAIGEAGLDYYYDNSSRQAQVKSFRIHINAARETGLPLIIHARNADDDMARILEDEMDKGAFGAVLHCFSSGAELAKRGVELGLYVSFSGILTFKKSEELRSIASEIPMDRLLVETDAPYLAPTPHRGARNEPGFTVHTAEVLAKCKQVSYADIAAQTTQNFFHLFSKVKHPSVISGVS